MIIKRKYLDDLLVYFQRTYGLYLVEFGRTFTKRKTITLHHPDDENWHIVIDIINMFKIQVNIEWVGKNDSMNKVVTENIKNGEYKGYSRKYTGEWLLH